MTIIIIIIIGHCCSLMIAFSKGHQGRCPAGLHLGRNGHHRLLHGREFNPASLQRGDSGLTDDDDGLMIMMIMKKIDKTMIESILQSAHLGCGIQAWDDDGHSVTGNHFLIISL